MARHPASDERSVLGPPGKSVKGERFYLVEIAQFVRTQPGNLAKFLRREGLLRRVTRGARGAVFYTSARGVALAIAHFRAIQGALYLKGQDPLATVELRAAKRRELRGRSATG
jgi:hypothetical protein